MRLVPLTHLRTRVVYSRAYFAVVGIEISTNIQCYMVPPNTNVRYISVLVIKSRLIMKAGEPFVC